MHTQSKTDIGVGSSSVNEQLYCVVSSERGHFDGKWQITRLLVAANPKLWLLKLIDSPNDVPNAILLTKDIAARTAEGYAALAASLGQETLIEVITRAEIGERALKRIHEIVDGLSTKGAM